MGGGALDAVADAIFLLSIVPSLVSLVFSGAMLFNILTSKELRMRIFQQLLAVLAFTDFIKCGSWLFGNKYDADTDLCYFQEYMFQLGAVAQTITTTVICGVALVTVKRGTVPSHASIINAGRVVVVLLVIMIALSINYKTARLFCDFSSSRFGLVADNYPLLGLTFLYLLPIYLSVFLDVVIAAEIHRSLKWSRVPALQANAGAATLKTFVTRLQVYPLIIATCNIVDTIFVGILAYSGNDHKWFGAPAALFMSCTGIFITVNYFYYQRTLSPACEKIASKFRCRGYISSEQINSNPDSSIFYTTGVTTTTELEMRDSGAGQRNSSVSTVATDVRIMSVDELKMLTVE